MNLPVGLVAWLVGRRVLDRSTGSEQRSAARLPRSGAAERSARGARARRSPKARPGAGRARGSSRRFAAASGLGALFVFRSTRHAEPVLDLGLFRARSFSVANAATLLYAMGFFAMLLGNILFLTSVWHYSILRAGLAVTPGPLVVAVVSGPAGRLAASVRLPQGTARRFRGLHGRPLVVRRRSRELHPDYAGVWLPGTLISRARHRADFPGARARPPSRASITSASLSEALSTRQRARSAARSVLRFWS